LINVPTLHAHDFRHTGAQLLKLKGCPIETISELLNHASIDVTRKYYLRQDKEKMSQEKDKYDV
jgi:integrase